MFHPLDNPVWNALHSGNESLALGNAQAKFYPVEISTFAGLPHNDDADFWALHQLAPPNSIYGIVSHSSIAVPPIWKLLHKVNVWQMICDRDLIPAVPVAPIVALGESDVPQMMALTQLTNPGPFSSQTLKFGNYSGIFYKERLVAMAGQRMQPHPYVEISAVCTHPDYLGKGYAKSLVLHLASHITSSSFIPFLHVRTDNTGAIGLYEALRFSKRKEMIVYVIQKDEKATKA